MKKIVVYHTKHLNINGGHTEFHGDNIQWEVRADGCLDVGPWQTAAEHGGAHFAPGVWEYVCVSESDENI